MNMEAMRVLVVQRDRNERAGKMVMFPETILLVDPQTRRRKHMPVRVESKVLAFGDYRLKDWPTGRVVETKRGANEVYNNSWGDDRERWLRSLGRLAKGCSHPSILLEGSMASYLEDRAVLANAKPGRAAAGLVRLLADADEHKVSVAWAGTHRSEGGRRRLGEAMIHWMLQPVYALAAREKNSGIVLEKT